MGSDVAEEKAVNDKNSASVGASYEDDNSVGAINIKSDVEYEHIFNFSGNDADDGDKKDDGNKKKDGWFKVEGSIEGSVGISGSASVSIYLSLAGRKEVSLELSASLFYKSSVSGSIEINPTLPALKIPVAGNALSISLTAGFFVTASGSFEIAFETGCKVGFSYCQGEGFNNLSQKPKTDYAMNIEGEVYVGFTLDITAAVCDEDIGEVGYGGKIGLNISAAPTSQDIDIDGVTVSHSCSRCVSGDISLKLELSPIVKLLGKDALEEVLPDFDFGSELEWELTPWHYSFTYDEFGLDLCNHVGCKFTIKVVDDGKPVEGAELNDYWPGAKNVYLGETDSLGLAQITLEGNTSGMYQVNITKGNKSAVVNFYVDDFEDILVRRGTGDWCSLSDSDSYSGSSYLVDLSKEEEPSTEGSTNGTGGDDSTTDPSDTKPNPTDPSGTKPNPTEPTEPFIYDEDDCNDKISWELWSDGTLYISGSGRMPDYSSADKVPWSCYNDFITSVEISYNIDTISPYAFYNCINLKSVNNFFVYYIGSYAFYNCRSLSDIYFSSFLDKIGDYAFANCSSLKNSHISATNIGEYAFFNCDSLTNIVVNCTDASWHSPSLSKEAKNFAFKDCDNLMSVEFTNGIKYFGRFLFENCKSLTNIVLPDSVTRIETGMFQNCTSLTNIVIPDNITAIYTNAFKDCIKLKNVKLSECLNCVGNYVFSGCVSLTTMSFPSSFTNSWSGGGIGSMPVNWLSEGLFYGCTSLKSVTFQDALVSEEKIYIGIMDAAFYNCTSLEHIDLPNNLYSIEHQHFGVGGAFGNCTSLKEIKLPDSLEYIESCAFTNCTSLTDIKLPNSLKSIGEAAFSGSGLTSIVIPPNVKALGRYAFAGCSNLTSLVMYKDTEIEDWTCFYDTPIQSTYRNFIYDNNSVGAKKPDFTSVSAQSLSIDTNVSKITAEYSNKVANAYYIIAVVKDPNAEDVLSADNLIYINQYTADKDGKISTLLPAPKDVGDDYDVVIFGAEGGADVPDKPEKGDVNGDGKVTVDDVTSIQKYIADAVKFDDAQITVADVNNDGKVNIDDVTMIQKYIADMIPSL